MALPKGRPLSMCVEDPRWPEPLSTDSVILSMDDHADDANDANINEHEHEHEQGYRAQHQGRQDECEHPSSTKRRKVCFIDVTSDDEDDDDDDVIILVPPPLAPSTSSSSSASSSTSSFSSISSSSSASSFSSASSSSSSASSSSAFSSASEVELVGETGNALSDFAHPRHICVNNLFSKTPTRSNANNCKMCYCYVCDVPAVECSMWLSGHCNAYPCTEWTWRREQRQRLKAQQRQRLKLDAPQVVPHPYGHGEDATARGVALRPVLNARADGVVGGRDRSAHGVGARRDAVLVQILLASSSSEDSSSSSDDSDEDSSDDDDDDAEVETSTLLSSDTAAPAAPTFSDAGAGAGAGAAAETAVAATVESGRHGDAILELAEALVLEY